jgi:hypothetical protein
MKKKNIRLSTFFGGLLFLTYAVYVKITGNFIVHESDPFSLENKANDSFSYYLNLFGSGSLGILQIYKSLLFIPSNKKYWDEYPEYHRKRIEYQRQQLKVNPARLVKVISVILLIFIAIMAISKIL